MMGCFEDDLCLFPFRQLSERTLTTAEVRTLTTAERTNELDTMT